MGHERGSWKWADRVIRSEVLRRQFLGLETHWFHPFWNFVAGSVLKAQVQVSPHNFVLLSLVFALYRWFVLFHDFLPLPGSPPEGGNRLSEEGVVGFFLNLLKIYENVGAFLGDFGLCLINSLFLLSPLLHSLLEKLIKALLGLASLLLDVLESAQRPILIPAVFLYEPILSLFQNGQTFLIDLAFLNEIAGTS